MHQLTFLHIQSGLHEILIYKLVQSSSAREKLLKVGRSQQSKIRECKQGEGKVE